MPFHLLCAASFLLHHTLILTLSIYLLVGLFIYLFSGAGD
jgi:hypothetical protein